MLQPAVAAAAAAAYMRTYIHTHTPAGRVAYFEWALEKSPQLVCYKSLQQVLYYYKYFTTTSTLLLQIHYYFRVGSQEVASTGILVVKYLY